MWESRSVLFRFSVVNNCFGVIWQLFIIINLQWVEKTEIFYAWPRLQWEFVQRETRSYILFTTWTNATVWREDTSDSESRLARPHSASPISRLHLRYYTNCRTKKVRHFMHWCTVFNVDETSRSGLKIEKSERPKQPF